MGKQLHATACFEIQLDDFFCCPIEGQFFSLLLLLQIEACFLSGSSSRGNVSSGVAVPFIARSIRFVVVVGRHGIIVGLGGVRTHTIERLFRVASLPRLASTLRAAVASVPSPAGRKFSLSSPHPSFPPPSPVSPFSKDRGAAGE